MRIQNESGSMIIVVVGIVSGLFLFLSSLMIFGFNFYKSNMQVKDATEYYDIMNHFAVSMAGARDIRQMNPGACPANTTPEAGGQFCFPDPAQDYNRCVIDGTGVGINGQYCIDFLAPGVGNEGQPSTKWDYKVHEEDGELVVDVFQRGESRSKSHSMQSWYQRLNEKFDTTVEYIGSNEKYFSNGVVAGKWLLKQPSFGDWILPEAKAQVNGAGGFGRDTFINTATLAGVQVTGISTTSNTIGGINCNYPTADCIKIRVCPSWRQDNCSGVPNGDEAYLHQRYAIYGNPKRIFTTSEEYTGDMERVIPGPLSPAASGVFAADEHCNRLAQSQNFAGNYRAWISASAGDEPAVRFMQSNQPYYTMSGNTPTVVANNWAGLTSGTLLSPVDFTETGVSLGTPNTKTNVRSDGTSLGAVHCSGWTSTVGNGFVGRSWLTSSDWTDGLPAGLAKICSASDELICVEQ